MLFWDDLKVGETCDLGTAQVTREEVIAFAERYDPQPFHLDDNAAAMTHFGKISASGWHTCAMVMRVIVDSFTERQLVSVGSPGVDNLRWLKPVFPGDTLAVTSETLELTPSRSKPGLGSARSRIEAVNQDGVKVLSMETILLVLKRTSAD
ncbi:MaoC family dehydratase [Sphingomicrobium astaxanthinifaciens]|uniref:MaoC family dehydratase n=1 Tax=Sphingomicrobium astaxanthinifaciens TaxID=1227949 RepID=UPI001FCA63C0|nr:MaoC family dehydratase [Sphingomicrobium astaxanthinifaciens]MCJ7422048.1 MaoC family dehydratase [Sphingomicrobium astaxanthinifaciens]